MEKFTKVTGVAAPLMRQNVDTDLVIRIERRHEGRARYGRACNRGSRRRGSDEPQRLDAPGPDDGREVGQRRFQRGRRLDAPQQPQSKRGNFAHILVAVQ